MKIFRDSLCKAVFLYGFIAVSPLVIAASGVASDAVATTSLEPSSPEQFAACGKEWTVGPDFVTWHEAQAFIAGLGDGWRTPELWELNELYGEMGQSSPIGTNVVWADRRDETTANIVYFSHDFQDQELLGFASPMAVAVRENKP